MKEKGTMMKALLQEKLTRSVYYSRDELQWLLDHIGDSDAQIRDELVYASFCHALLNQLISIEDARWLVQQILGKDLLFQDIDTIGPATLTRSFTALLLALLISLDNQVDNLYHGILTGEERALIFHHALTYLESETDRAGWSENLGWVHAVAHGAELLLHASLHDQFPTEQVPAVWETMHRLLRQQTQVFSAGEERRLALVISQLVLQEKLDQRRLSDWIERLDFPDREPEEYFASVNLENFLASIYLTLDKEACLRPSLKRAILNIWKGC